MRWAHRFAEITPRKGCRGKQTGPWAASRILGEFTTPGARLTPLLAAKQAPSPAGLRAQVGGESQLVTETLLHEVARSCRREVLEQRIGRSSLHFTTLKTLEALRFKGANAVRSRAHPVLVRLWRLRLLRTLADEATRSAVNRRHRRRRVRRPRVNTVGSLNQTRCPTRCAGRARGWRSACYPKASVREVRLFHLIGGPARGVRRQPPAQD